MSYSARSISSTKIHVSCRGRESFQHIRVTCGAALWQGMLPLSITQALSNPPLQWHLQKMHTHQVTPWASDTNRALGTQYANASPSYFKVYTLQKICHSTTLFLRHLLSRGKNFSRNPRDSRPHRLSWWVTWSSGPSSEKEGTFPQDWFWHGRKPDSNHREQHLPHNQIGTFRIWPHFSKHHSKNRFGELLSI